MDDPNYWDPDTAPVDPREALRGGAEAVRLAGAAAAVVGDGVALIEDAREAVSDAVRKVEEAEERAERAADDAKDRANKALTEARKKLSEKTAYQRWIDVLDRAGWKGAHPGFGALILQYQRTFKLPEPIELPKPAGLKVNFLVQVAGKAEFITDTDVNKLTVRVDQETQALKQVEFELRSLLGTPSTPKGLFQIKELRPKVTLDLPPPATLGKSLDPNAPPGTLQLEGSVQLGLEATVVVPGMIDAQTGKPVEFKTRGAIGVDMKKLLDSKHWSEVVKFVMDYTAPKVPVDDIEPYKKFHDALGGNWTISRKFFVELSGTLEFWLNFFKLMSRLVGIGVNAAVRTGQAVVTAAENVMWAVAKEVAEARVFLAENPRLIAGISGFALMVTAATVAHASIGRFVIGRALKAGRDDAIANAFCAGYAEELDRAVNGKAADVMIRTSEYAMYDFKAALDEISSVVHGREPGAYYKLRPGLTSRDVEYAQALNGAARDLGRAAALFAVTCFIQKRGQKQGLLDWIKLQESQRAKLPALQSRGFQSLRQRYLAILSKDVGSVDVEVMGLELEQLDTIV